jgi:hypothetical protein
MTIRANAAATTANAANMKILIAQYCNVTVDHIKNFNLDDGTRRLTEERASYSSFISPFFFFKLKKKILSL